MTDHNPLSWGSVAAEIQALKTRGNATEEEKERILQRCMMAWELTWGATLRAITVIDKPLAKKLALHIKCQLDCLMIDIEERQRAKTTKQT